MKYLGPVSDNKDYATKEYVDGAVAADAAASASVNSSTGVITFSNAGGTTLFTLQLPLYNGSVS